MLVIDDLAERWKVSLAQAKRIVREEQVPFLTLRAWDMRIDWRFVRFTLEAVEEWERGRQRILPGAALAPAAPPTTFRNLRRHSRPERRKEARRKATPDET